jgi:thiamine-phosphate pyrophosphorylase
LNLKKYLITDPKYYRYSHFKEDLERAVKNSTPDFALFRDKSTDSYNSLSKEFCSIIKNSSTKGILHSNFKLAEELNCYGVHITSQNSDSVTEAKERGLFTVVSTHNEDEVERAIKFKADAITYSPIFGYEKGEPKGVDKLREVVDRWSRDVNIFALGGVVTEREVEELKSVKNLTGFASIRAFLPN